MKTEIYIILDRSGSMGGMADEVIGGTNNFIKKQSEPNDEAYITLVLFDDQYEVIRNRVSAKQCKPISDKEYYTRGLTALNDALGKTVSGAIAFDTPDTKFLFYIVTDGYENASKEFTAEQVKKLVANKEKSDKWNFNFVTADLSLQAHTVNIARGLGISGNATFNVNKSSEDYGKLFDAISEGTTAYRSTGVKTTLADIVNNVS